MQKCATHAHYVAHIMGPAAATSTTSACLGSSLFGFCFGSRSPWQPKSTLNILSACVQCLLLRINLQGAALSAALGGTHSGHQLASTRPRPASHPMLAISESGAHGPAKAISGTSHHVYVHVWSFSLERSSVATTSCLARMHMHIWRLRNPSPNTF